jgi:hypothetical protein
MTKEEILKKRLTRNIAGREFSPASVYDVRSFNVTDRVILAMDEYAKEQIVSFGHFLHKNNIRASAFEGMWHKSIYSETVYTTEQLYQEFLSQQPNT